MKSIFFHTALLAAGIGAASISHAQTSYQFIDLGNGSAAGINDLGQVVGTSSFGATLWNGSTAIGLTSGQGGAAFAINNAGQIIGNTTSNGLDTGALWNGSTLTNLSGPSNSYGFAINSAGVIAGRYVNPANLSNASAMLWNGNTSTVLAPGNSTGVSWYASGINDSGVVVGQSLSNRSDLATVWNGSKTTLLPTLPGGDWASAAAINNAGEIVGDSNNDIRGTTYFATVWKGNNITTLGSLGGFDSYASGVNNAGQIVGTSSDLTGNYYATIWQGSGANGTAAINLNTFLTPSETQAGWVLASATGINSQGWIIGDAVNSKTGADDAFLLKVSAVPEPGSYAMMLLGIGLIGAFVRRKAHGWHKTPSIQPTCSHRHMARK